jgi:bisphosphoglycerate-independent phosphoglycerate mutase (AlkP superfamily)
MIIKEGLSPVELSVGNLADVAPTILHIMDIEIPAEMTGRNLL